MSVGYFDRNNNFIVAERFHTTKPYKPNPWCPVCVIQERRMVLNGKTYSCIQCGKSFPIEDITIEQDIQKEDDELIKLMRSKLK
jgi:hypothetical protein